MIADLAPNLMSRPYRGLSVQEVSFELTQAALLEWITGRSVYRRTEFILVRNGAASALVTIGRRDSTELFGRVTEASVMALPAEVAMVDSPGTDVGNASAMAEAAGRHRRPGVKAYVVTGRYRHVNFIWQPQPVTVYVDEVVPPHPAKLVDMARQAIAFDEDLPPIAIVQRLISIPQLSRSSRGGSCLLPCQGAAGESTGEAGQFLDRGPAYQPDWVLIGCHRSEEIFEQFYGHRPDTVSFCPEQHSHGLPAQARRLTKCCLLERGIQARGSHVVVVPWGARLDEVRSALELIVTPEDSGAT